MAGASPEERHHFHLADKTLGQWAIARPNGVRDNNANRFEQLKCIGLSKRHPAQTCQLGVAAILVVHFRTVPTT